MRWPLALLGCVFDRDCEASDKLESWGSVGLAKADSEHAPAESVVLKPSSNAPFDAMQASLVKTEAQGVRVDEEADRACFMRLEEDTGRRGGSGESEDGDC